MNIVLIGARGTGKSTVGAAAAKKLEMNYVGLDAYIVEKAGMSIPEIVEKEGWDGFREKESIAAMEISSYDNYVIDTGGGVILRPQNVEYLRRNGVVFWLTGEIEVLANRIEGDPNRPPLTENKSLINEIHEVLKERTPKYQAASDYSIDSSNIGIEETADRVVSLYRQHLNDI